MSKITQGLPLYERLSPSHAFKKDLALDLKMASIKGTSGGGCCFLNLSFIYHLL